jgi:hypothetical protein
MLRLCYCLCICLFQDINVIVVIIIICHQLDSDRPVWPSVLVSLKVLQDVFAHLVYNLVLFLASCFCSFLLRVLANLICVSLVSGQLVLLSALPEYLHSFCGHKGCTPLFFWKYINLCYVWCTDGKRLLRSPHFCTAVSVSGRKLYVYMGWHETGRWGLAILKLIPLGSFAAFLITGSKITLM